MSINPEDAKATHEALREAAVATRPVTAIAYEMKRRAREWANVVENYPEAAGEGQDEEPVALIELLGAVTPGMFVFNPTVQDPDEPWLYVVRTLQQGGQWSLHLDGPRGGAVYANFFGQSSPVLVKR